MKKKSFISCCLFSIIFFSTAYSQNGQTERLKVFIDCSNNWCDMTFIRSEINLVDFLLDNKAADVHVLITNQRTGGGGEQYQLIFFGQNSFRNLSDTIRFNTSANGTDFENRDQLIKYLKMGLAPYVAKTAAAKDVKIEFKKADIEQGKKTESAPATKDPWNYWVFTMGANGNINADDVYKSLRFSGNFSVNRTTEELKVSFRLYGSKNKSTYEYETITGNEKFVVNNNNYGFSHFLVKSLSSHWSYGYEANYSSSTFSNNKGMMFLKSAIEYDIFPYKEVNNKYFTISYGLNVRKNKYYDTTIFNKVNETLFAHGLEANISFNQKWGSTSVGINYQNYLHNWNFYNLGMSGNINVRITGGLSFNFFAFGALTRDQLYLPKGGATEQEVLTRRRQLASGYNYYTSFGINYRFGSKLNNFVNPRFEGSGGGMFFFN
jgi:hypothetical protein